MKKPSVVFFVMPQEGHFQPLRALIAGVAEQRMTVYVFTHRRFRARVERAGGTFIDLFSRYPLEHADDESLPFSCRFVSFAGCYAEKIAHDLDALAPSLVVYDTFAVIGRVVGGLLGIPYINVCTGHNRDPAGFMDLVRADPRVEISAKCHRAVATLRDRHGVKDASPFFYWSALSPFLNVYCEPPTYLTAAERRVFEPVAFYGSLPPLQELQANPGGASARYFGSDATQLKVYVSFGTVVWRCHWAATARDALVTISESLARMRNVRAVISMGGTNVGDEFLRALTKHNVSVANHVDQWRILQGADIFITHHGLNSTHEAIFHEVPMISYPFFSDQPGLARKCQLFALAIPLADSPRAPITHEDVIGAVTECGERRESLRACLAEARSWELDVIANRGSVLRRITELIEV